MCLCYNWKNYLSLVLLDWKQDCFLHLKYRALFQLELPGSSYTTVSKSYWPKEEKQRPALPCFQCITSLQNGCLRYDWNSDHRLCVLTLSSNIEENILKNCIKTVWFSNLLENCWNLPSSPFTLKLGVGRIWTYLVTKFCYFKYVLNVLSFHGSSCTRCTCSLKQNI